MPLTAHHGQQPRGGTERSPLHNNPNTTHADICAATQHNRADSGHITPRTQQFRHTESKAPQPTNLAGPARHVNCLDRISDCTQGKAEKYTPSPWTKLLKIKHNYRSIRKEHRLRTVARDELGAGRPTATSACPGHTRTTVHCRKRAQA